MVVSSLMSEPVDADTALLAFRAYVKALRAVVCRLQELRTVAPSTVTTTDRVLGWLLQFEQELPALEKEVREKP
jgi:hypothetical protein